MTLPGKTDIKALSGGEDINCVVSFSGKWVAYAKAQMTGGTDYHSFKLWDVYIVSIEGVGAGEKEIKIDTGYWPSWGKGDVLYYNQPDGSHTKIYKVTIDDQGASSQKKLVVSTKTAYSSIKEIGECFVAPDGSWFAGRTRGSSSYTGVGAYDLQPPKWYFLGKAGSVGCMPYVAPDGTWGFHAGSGYGIRWGHAPHVSNREEDQQLIPPKSGGKCYHPGVSTDGKWVMTGHSTTSDQNAGPWEIYVYRLDPATMKISDEQKLTSGGFNGWPHIWVKTSTTTPPQSDSGTAPPTQGDGESPPGSYGSVPGTDGGLPPATTESGASLPDSGGSSNQSSDGVGTLVAGCSMATSRSSVVPVLLLLFVILVWIGGRRS
jgi:hypothetical protein